ncbi:hypothetical protein Anas_12780 [Armadillidium nasatum]|uniref:Uncharacterized protein n=1 Tax=Armadillidium nasatum TaxID=96803 RepID=A0A5N5T7S4_9CRUS|nr:hypothetical protein Anas_12780 [Armadillidium nasatum]
MCTRKEIKLSDSKAYTLSLSNLIRVILRNDSIQECCAKKIDPKCNDGIMRDIIHGNRTICCYDNLSMSYEIISIEHNQELLELGNLPEKYPLISFSHDGKQFIIIPSSRFIQFSLPSFSPALADYLQGKATQSRIHYYRKLFVSELSVYLNQNNYLVSKNRAEQKWGYKALEKAILTAYPNVHQDEGVKASYKRTGPLKWVISHLADRRRKQVTRKEGKVFVCETTSVDEAFNLLQTLPSKLWQCTQLKKALFITKDLRCRLQAEETLPDYLLVDSILCYEIGLRLGSNINSLMTAAKTIIRKLHRIDISSIDALIDYLSEGDQRLVSSSEIDPFPGPYATLKDGEMIIYLPKERKMYIQNCSSLRVVIILLGVYYILDLTYPHDFGQVLGFFQTILLSESFELQYRSSKFNNIMDFPC